MVEVEYCDPFDKQKYGYWMKLEHSGRYIFARNFIKDNLKNAYVADISCATGYGTEYLSDVCNKIDGYDLRNENLKLALKRKIKNADFFQVDFNKEVLNKKKYDAVISFETIEHIEQTEKFLKSLQNILKIGGYLLISVPNYKYEQLDEKGNIIYKFHKHVFKKEDIVKLLNEHSFEIEKILGQSLCNMIVSKEYELKHGDLNIYNEKLLNKYNYSKDAIIMNSYIYAYPNDLLIDESYSYIFICKKI